MKLATGSELRASIALADLHIRQSVISKHLTCCLNNLSKNLILMTLRQKLRADLKDTL